MRNINIATTQDDDGKVNIDINLTIKGCADIADALFQAITELSTLGGYAEAEEIEELEEETEEEELEEEEIEDEPKRKYTKKVKEVEAEEVDGWEVEKPLADHDFYRIKDVAGLLSCSEQTVYNYVNSGKLPKSQRINGKNYWKKHEIDAAIETMNESKNLAEEVQGTPGAYVEKFVRK